MTKKLISCSKNYSSIKINKSKTVFRKNPDKFTFVNKTKYFINNLCVIIGIRSITSDLVFS